MTKQHKKNIVLTAGGTGGHIYPAEALAEELQKRGYEVVFYTDARGLENYQGSLRQVENRAIFSGSVIGKSVLTKVKSLCKVALGVVQAGFYLLRNRPLAVVGFGGYASFPTAVAAIILRIPLVVHEQNSVMSRTNRILAHFATITAQSFRHVKNTPNGAKEFLSGMPIRENIVKLHDWQHNFANSKSEFTLLILGGSQGAKIFSDVIPQALELLPEDYQKRCVVYQQCRRGDEEVIAQKYANLYCKKTIAPFFNNMSELYQKADLMISRAGASSIYEIAAAGVPAVLVPLPTAADNHQYYNAKELADNKGAILIKQEELTADKLSKLVVQLADDPQQLKELAENAKKCAIIDAPKRLADAIEKLRA